MIPSATSDARLLSLLRGLRAPTLLSVVGYSFSAVVLYLIVHAIYNLFFHPLRKFPGPKHWIAFPLLRHISACTGNYDTQIREYHAKYGSILRYGINEISFTTAAAWKDIYGHRHPELPKVIGFNDNQTPSILSADGPDHSRFRKTLSHAFSDKAIREQEPLIKVYIDLLIKKLNDFAVTGDATDMVKWYNLTTFDIIGDLAFGEPFGGLQGSDYHTWVKNIFLAAKYIPFLLFMGAFPVLKRLIEVMIPASLRAKREEQIEFARAITMKRVNRSDLHGRGDFMDYMLKHRGEKDGMSDAELVANSNVLIGAGSETTATLLSGVTYWLLRTPEALKKATNEVRLAFKSENDIDFINTTNKLPYILACLNEGLRIYPPVPTNIPRRADLPVQIDGQDIPGGTNVSVHQSAAYWSTQNFYQPRTFIPERWLPESFEDKSSPFFNDNRAVVQPFSVGPRNCVGKSLAINEMRLILARVLYNFDLELCEESNDWANQKSYILWDKPGLICKLKKRPTYVSNS